MSGLLAQVEAAVVETAPAKLNLALHVRRRRPDGYHDIDTIFAFARHGDTVTVRPGDERLTITGPFAAGLDTGADNLVNRAAAVFGRAFGIADAHAITLEKHLPVASGIGGGSADAAATLRALARLHGIDPADERLVAAACSLGADVPACLLGRTSFGRGRGDELTPLPPLGNVPALLVNPMVPIATGPVFAGWDGEDRGGLADGGDTLGRALAGRNDLQPGAERIAPVVAELVETLGAQPGAVLARMSGSGATCFALFDSAAARDRADALIGARHQGWWRLATTIV